MSALLPGMACCCFGNGGLGALIVQGRLTKCLTAQRGRRRHCSWGDPASGTGVTVATPVAPLRDPSSSWRDGTVPSRQVFSPRMIDRASPVGLRRARPACCRMRAMLNTFIASVLLIAPAGSGARAQGAPPANPAPSVGVVPVVVKNVAPAHTFVGRVTAIQAVQVVPRVTAFVEDIPVNQGSD